MSLLKQDGPDDIVGAGIQGAIAGFQIGKIAFLVIAGAGIVLFHVFKFLLPIIIRFLAFVLPILWRLLAQICRWISWAVECGIAALKSCAAKQQNPAEKSAR
jgi:hypothetical protein